MWKLKDKERNKGFTLTEVIVTMGVIGILASLGVVGIGKVKGTTLIVIITFFLGEAESVNCIKES